MEIAPPGTEFSIDIFQEYDSISTIAVSYTHLDVYERQTVVCTGTPETVAQEPRSYTGQYLKKYLS